MVVAAGAAYCEPQPGLAGRLDAVDHRLHPPLLGDDAPLAVDPVIAIEPRGNDLVTTGIVQHVTGELLHRELVERHVAVEGADQPVSPWPVGAAGIGLVAMAIGIPRRVEPLDRHPFAEMRAGQHAIDIFFIRIEGLVRHKRVDVGGHRWQAGEIERDPSRECHAVGLGIRRQAFVIEPGQNEPVDRHLRPRSILHRRHGRPLHPFKRPMSAILRPLRDPPTENLSLGRSHRLVDVRRRHDHVGIGARDAGEDLAGLRLAGHDRRAAALECRDGDTAVVEPQPRLPVFGIGPMAGEAAVGEDRPHITVEVETRVGGVRQLSSRQADKSRQTGTTGQRDHRSGASHRTNPRRTHRGKHPRRRSAAFSGARKPAVKRGPARTGRSIGGSLLILASERGPAKPLRSLRDSSPSHRITWPSVARFRPRAS